MDIKMVYEDDTKRVFEVSDVPLGFSHKRYFQQSIHLESRYDDSSWGEYVSVPVSSEDLVEVFPKIKEVLDFE